MPFASDLFRMFGKPEVTARIGSAEITSALPVIRQDRRQNRGMPLHVNMISCLPWKKSSC